MKLKWRTCTGADEGEVGDDLLGVLSLSSPRLTSNQNRPFDIANVLCQNSHKNLLVLDFEAHGVVGALSNGKDVWWNLY